MSKVIEKILADFKKANATRKQLMAEKYGYKTIGELESALLEQLGLPAEVEVKKKPSKKKEEEPEVDLPTDVVIAFDTTGSMASYIAAVRKHVEETIAAMFTNTPNLMVKVVAFGDYCDMKSATIFGDAYQETSLTNDANTLIKFVKTARNTGGGDTPEFYELVLQKILDETPWRERSNRSILLIADYDPHPVGYTCKPFVVNAQIDWRKEAIKANSMKVRVDTLRILPSMNWYAELSQMTEGACMNFKTSAKTSDLLEAATYMTSGSKMSLRSMSAKYRRALTDGDDELVGAYKGMARSRGINLDE